MLVFQWQFVVAAARGYNAYGLTTNVFMFKVSIPYLGINLHRYTAFRYTLLVNTLIRVDGGEGVTHGVQGRGRMGEGCGVAAGIV